MAASTPPMPCSTASRTVCWGSSWGSCGRYPIFRPGIGTASPSISLSSPAMIFSSVLLPLPFTPSTPILAPGKKDRLTPFRICRFGGTILPTRFMVKTYWAMLFLVEEGRKGKPGIMGDAGPRARRDPVWAPSGKTGLPKAPHTTGPLVLFFVRRLWRVEGPARPVAFCCSTSGGVFPWFDVSRSLRWLLPPPWQPPTAPARLHPMPRKRARWNRAPVPTSPPSGLHPAWPGAQLHRHRRPHRRRRHPAHAF